LTGKPDTLDASPGAIRESRLASSIRSQTPYVEMGKAGSPASSSFDFPIVILAHPP
jgi:hypothetical protein